MLNKNNERELAYLVTIDDIKPIVGSDNCECAVVGGWGIMVRKGTFNKGDVGIYFEIDSRVPANRECFAFLEKRNYKIKTQRFTFGGKGNFISQGLLMHPSDFGWTSGSFRTKHDMSLHDGIVKKTGEVLFVDDESRFLTKELGVTYIEDDDNKRKANSVDKYVKMTQRHKNIFKKPWAKWLMKRKWGRNLMFFFFGKKKDKKGAWPNWVIKTDEERAQNQPWRFGTGSTDKWIVTEKIDGTSTTATWKRGKFGKHEFYICSRNVVFDEPDKKCFYESNVYTEMAEKYDFERVLGEIANDFNLEWVTLQGETYGNGIQRRDYGMKGHDFMGFNLIFSDCGRLNSYESRAIMEEYNIPWVPLLCDDYVLPDTVEEILAYAEGASTIDGLPREGIVLRSQDGMDSFKAVSNSFLLKYHSY